MNAPSWERVKQVFQDVLDRPPHERAAGVRDLCGDDRALQAEVESLLATHEQAGSFAEAPALEMLNALGASRPTSPDPVMSPGGRLGVYEIRSLIGAGGMGEVYCARDTRLRRDVAVKVLPAAFATDLDRVRRFEQEALAAAALNHPNILAVYDAGTTDGMPYVVSELLDGETLRQLLTNGALPVRKAIDYAQQFAQGLGAAHAKGIVHRDLKPENLFITRDGRIKILDFGLAKLMEGPVKGIQQTNLPTLPTPTEPGLVMGTVGYMSPEQIRAQPIDHRADLFSFGAIVYEMLSGRRAFRGGTNVDTMSAILKEEPPDLVAINRNIDPALERIVRRCLEKSPDERFQAARDIAFALEALSGTSTAIGSTVPIAAWKSSRILMALAGAAAVALGSGFLIGNWTARRLSPSMPRFVPLTFRRGTIHNARFASDNQTIVYDAAWDGKPFEIYATRRDVPESRPLVQPPALVLGVSSGGEMAISVGCDGLEGDCDGTLASVPLAGGSPRELLEHVGEADWSPDGTRLAVIVHGPKDVFRLESPIGNVLYQSRQGMDLHQPRFSPSGDRIAFTETGPMGVSIATVDLAGHKTTLAAGYLVKLAWSPSGDEVWFSGLNGRDTAGWNIYGVTLKGQARVVWAGDGMHNLLDVARDGRALVERVQPRMASVGVIGEAKERDLSPFLWSIADGLSADGRTLLLTDFAYGQRHKGLYLRRTDGTPPAKLADGGAEALSPDGKWAIGRQEERPPKLFVVPTGPGEVKFLPGGPIEDYDRVAWVPDQMRIVFAAKELDHDWRCYVQDVAGGLPRPITPEGVWTAHITKLLVTPDGRDVAAEASDRIVALYPIDGGPPRPILGILPGNEPIQWSRDERYLYVRDSGRLPATVYRLNLATGRREPWKEIAPADPAGVRSIYKVFMTRDVSTYVYSYQRTLSELYLVEGLK